MECLRNYNFFPKEHNFNNSINVKYNLELKYKEVFKLYYYFNHIYFEKEWTTVIEITSNLKNFINYFFNRGFLITNCITYYKV